MTAPKGGEGRGCRGPTRRVDMKLKWIALIAALAIPALGWAGTTALRASQPCGENCPFPCPLLKR